MYILIRIRWPWRTVAYNSRPAPTPGDAFGFCIAAAGNNIAAADYRAGNYAGVAYLFNSTSGSLLQTFQNPGSGNNFGSSVAVVGNSVVVGDQQANGGEGAAYLFDSTSGSLVHTLQDPQGGPYDYHFGRYVVPSSKGLLVSAPDSGVFLFDPSSGSLTTTLLRSTLGSYAASFGEGISGFGNDILASYSMMVVNGQSVSYVGHVGLFDGSSGSLVRSYNQYGLFLGAVGNEVVVGSGFGSGSSVYLLDGSTGSLLTTIAEPFANDGFGDAMAIMGDDILIGAPYTNNSSGAAYLYDANSGSLLQTYLPPSGSNGAFGGSVATVGNNVLIGASGNIYEFQGTSVPEPSTFAFSALVQSVLPLMHGGESGRRMERAAGPNFINSQELDNISKTWAVKIEGDVEKLLAQRATTLLGGPAFGYIEAGDKHARAAAPTEFRHTTLPRCPAKVVGVTLLDEEPGYTGIYLRDEDGGLWPARTVNPLPGRKSLSQSD